MHPRRRPRPRFRRKRKRVVGVVHATSDAGVPEQRGLTAATVVEARRPVAGQRRRRPSDGAMKLSPERPRARVRPRAPPVAPRRGGVRGEADAAAAVPSAPEHAVDRAARKERDGVIPRRGEDATAAVVAVRDVRFDRGDRGRVRVRSSDATPLAAAAVACPDARPHRDGAVHRPGDEP
eukprot:31413-Pelagococcus_subviridis.AAC.2